MVYLDQVLHILYFTSLALPSIILAGHGLLVKMLIILELHIYFDQILHTGTLIYILTLSETLVCQRVTKVTSNDVTSSPA